MLGNFIHNAAKGQRALDCAPALVWKEFASHETCHSKEGAFVWYWKICSGFAQVFGMRNFHSCRSKRGKRLFQLQHGRSKGASAKQARELFGKKQCCVGHLPQVPRRWFWKSHLLQFGLWKFFSSRTHADGY